MEIASPTWIYSLYSGLNQERIYSGCAALEGAFHSSLRGGREGIGRVFSWVQGVSVSKADTIQMIFNGVSGVSTLYYAKRVADLLSPSPSYYLLRSIFLVPSVAGVAFVVGVVAVNLMTPMPSDDPKLPSAQQLIAKSLHTTKLVLNVALSFLTKNPLSLSMTLAATAYNLYQTKNLEELPIPKEGEGEVSSKHFEALYDLFKSALAELQFYPEFTERIFLIQQFLLGGDLFFMMKNLYSLLENEYRNQDTRLKVAAATLIPISLVSALIMFLCRRSHPDLKEAIESVNIKPELMKQFKITWGNSPIHLLMRLIQLNRLIVTGIYSFFSKHKMAAGISLGAQLHNHIRIAQIFWIELLHTFDSLKMIEELGGVAKLNRWQFDRIEVNYTFMIHRAIRANPSVLKESVQVICDYATKAFSGSLWREWLYNLYRNGVYVGQTTEFSVDGMANFQRPSPTSLFPYLGSVAVRIIKSSFVRSATVSFAKN